MSNTIRRSFKEFDQREKNIFYEDVKLLGATSDPMEIEKSINTLSLSLDAGLIDSDSFQKALDKTHLVKKQVWVTRGGKTFQQTVYVKDGEDRTYEAEIGEELSPAVKGMNITKYSDKSFLISEDTYSNLSLLKEIKEETGSGVYNKYKKGWFFPISKLDTVLGFIWASLVESGQEEKAKAVQNQKNESLDKGSEVNVGGLSGKVTEGTSDSNGITYDVELKDGTKLNNVNENVIDVKPETDDKKIKEIVGNALPESRVKIEKQLFGIKPIENIHDYSLQEYMVMNGVPAEDILKVVAAFLNKSEKEPSGASSGGGGGGGSSSKIEGLTKKQLISKLIYNHYQSVKGAIDNGLEIKEESLALYPELITGYKKKRQQMSEETKRKISEALKKNGPDEEVDPVVNDISEEEAEKLKNSFKSVDSEEVRLHQSKLAELVKAREISEKEMYAAYAKGKEIDDYQEKQDANEEARVKRRVGEKLDTEIRTQKNIVQSLENGGSLMSTVDKVGVNYENIPDFRQIDSSNITYDIDSILTDERPGYIPEINEEAFKRQSYIFDTIRTDKDSYLVSVNGYTEKSMVDHGYTRTKDGEYDPKAGGYVTMTLDQLVLTQDYYTTKQKALFKKAADDRNKRGLAHWNGLSSEKREGYMMQRNIYHSLPAKLKKKMSRDQFEELSWQEREKFYKPIKHYGVERLKSKFDEHHMANSFHTMYERFVDPDAKKKNGKGVSLSRGEKGYNMTAHADAWKSWSSFREMLDWKINDISIQREEVSNNRKKALETSFGESNTNDALFERQGILVKRQNGDKISPIEIEELENAWVKVQGTFGELKENAKKDGLKISHTGNKHIFAMKAIGVYVPSMKTIGVTAKYGQDQLGFTLGHEAAHWIDGTIGKETNKRHASDNYESTAGQIAIAFRKNMNAQSKSKYINATHECFARAMEQYNAIETMGKDAQRVDKDYVVADEYVSLSVYQTTIKPLIETFLSENKELLKSLENDFKNIG